MTQHPTIRDYTTATSTRGQRLSDEQLVDDIRRVGRVLGGRPSLKQYKKHGSYSETAIRNHFDGYCEAVAAAGFSEQPDRNGGTPPNKIPDEELLDELRRAAEELGHTPRSRSEEVKYSEWTYSKRFGSWGEALDAAGLEREKGQYRDLPVAERVAVSDVVDAIINVAAKVDRPPFEHEVHEQTDILTVATNEIAGTWAETLRMAGFPPRYQGGNASKSRERRPDHYGRNWEEQRHAALVRDRWRCQDCGLEQQDHVEQYGRSLHMHHIRPIRSFETPEDANFLENLITLCQDCHDKWEPMTQRDFAGGSE